VRGGLRVEATTWPDETPVLGPAVAPFAAAVQGRGFPASCSAMLVRKRRTTRNSPVGLLIWVGIWRIWWGIADG
jgi:hypothetical protein